MMRNLNQGYTDMFSDPGIFCKISLFALIYLVCSGFQVMTLAQNLEQDDSQKTLSPYFFIPGGDSTTDMLPLNSTQADVNIAGVIADVHVTQVYHNQGKKPLEAIYIFPASTRAAVYGLQMKIGERTIVAKIEETETARAQYEQARDNGQSASLLEQKRPNVFQMNVANIMPGDVIHVELFYTETLVPLDGKYEFVYPTVVGPRYSNTPVSEFMAAESWVANPYLAEGESPTYDFDLNLNLDGGIPVSKIASSSHKIDISWQDKNRAKITLAPNEKNGGNRDFILSYQLAGKKIQSGLLLYEGKEENFFLAMIQPPDRITKDKIVPREYIFIVDVSGSMNGYPLSISKDLLRDLISNLSKTDKFNVLLFAGGSKLLAENSLPATSANISRAINLIDNEKGGGGTELLPALRKAFTIPSSEGFARSVVLVTDGYVSIEREAFEFIRRNLGQANVFTFGIGTSVNRFLIEGLARAGTGESFVATKNAEARNLAVRFREYISAPVLTDISINYGSNDVYDIEPISIPDVFARRPVMIYGKYHGKFKGKIQMSGLSGDEKKFATSLSGDDYKTDDKNSALKYLWARNKIAVLGDYGPDNESLKQEITTLGLKYNLLTAYTSFVAIDSEIRNQTGVFTSVKQPLPLPQGVPLSAVGRTASNGYRVRKLGNAGSADYARKINIEEATESMPELVQVIKITCDDRSLEPMIKMVISDHMDVLDFCYRKRLKQLTSNPPSGQIKIKIVLAKDGKIISVKLEEDLLQDNNITDCILARIRGWHFPSEGISAESEFLITISFGQNNK